MTKFLSSNKYFLIGCFLFFLIGGLILSQIQKPEVIFFFSERRSTFGDLFFTYFTKVGEELFYLIFFISFLFVKVRYAILIPLVGVVVSILSSILKSYFKHDRPLMYLENLGLDNQINFIEGIELYTGQTSFPSGHSMSGFALYGIIAFIVSGKRLWGILLFVIALLVGVSRIYLVQHFFQDVYLGSMIGIVLAMMIYLLQNQIKVDDDHWLNQPLFGKKKSEVRV